MDNISSSTPAPNATYCNLSHVRAAFAIYYPYLSLVICIFGAVTNVLNICILTSRHMRCPTNAILTAFAFSNLLIMVEYIPFAFVYNESKAFASHFSYTIAVFIIFHAIFTQAVHFISCSLTVMLAIWQYIAVRFPQHNNKWCSSQRTTLSIILTYLFCSFICIPLNLSLTIKKKLVQVDDIGKIVKNLSLPNVTIYVIGYHNNFHHIGNYVYAIVMKLVPSLLLTVLSGLLIYELVKAKERRRKLLNPKKEENVQIREPSQRFLEKEKQTDRTTKMLLLVLLLYLMVELPQAFFGLLNVIIGEVFEKQCYQPLGDIVDVLTLTNFSINFILYCIMSKKFRTVFKESFFPYIPCFNASKESWISLNTLQTYV